MRLLPSQIRYSQNSISNIFGDGDYIGDVLDDLCDGRMQKRDFPLIEVAKIGKRWYAADNRRLWVFRKLEELGMCKRVPVYEIDEIPSYKMTTTNGGKDVTVRGYPGGVWINKLEYYQSGGYNNSYDEFCRSMQKRDLPKIEVARIGSYWYTANNRRLWVFQKLEELGKCYRIPVYEIDYIPRKKMTTTNEGWDVRVRGDPGGVWLDYLESDSNSDDVSSDDEFYDRFDNFWI